MKVKIEYYWQLPGPHMQGWGEKCNKVRRGGRLAAKSSCYLKNIECHFFEGKEFKKRVNHFDVSTHLNRPILSKFLFIEISVHSPRLNEGLEKASIGPGEAKLDDKYRPFSWGHEAWRFIISPGHRLFTINWSVKAVKMQTQTQDMEGSKTVLNQSCVNEEQ